MNNKPLNPPAFPVNECWRAKEHEEGHSCLYDDEQGMTLRDYFAGQALIGLITNAKLHEPQGKFSTQAYIYADTMLAEREKNA